jgi:hypothetical protein
LADSRNCTGPRHRAALVIVSPEDLFDLDPEAQVMAAITQAGEELLLPDQSLGRKEAQFGLRSHGTESIAAMSQEGFA